ncbi:MAG: hypothetical protein ACREI7_01780, partial [Myxococcota bacterium]
LVLLLHPSVRREPWRGWCAGLLLGAAAGAKNEGMLLAPAALILAAWWGRGNRLERRAMLMRAGAVLCLALLLIVAWRSEIPNRNDEGYFEEFSVARLVAQLPSRIALIAPAVARLSFDRERWGLLFWLAPALFVVGARGLRRRDCRVAAALLATELAMVVAAYSVVGKPSIVDVTWDRFVLQMAAPLAIVLAAASGRVIAVATRRSRPRARAGGQLRVESGSRLHSVARLFVNPRRTIPRS